MAAALGDPLAGLPPGWEACASEYGSQYVYYWNHFTNETTWEKPTGVARAQGKRGRGTGWGKRGGLRAPSGCFLFPALRQIPATRSSMKQNKDVFSVLLKRGMPALNSDQWWRGAQNGHAFLPLETLVACMRVNRAWRKVLTENGFNYGIATLGIALSKWRVEDADSISTPKEDVDALAELSKRIRIQLQYCTMASGARLREVRQFLFRHSELSQKNATCREDPSAKPFLPALLQGSSWKHIFDSGFWLSLAAREPPTSCLSTGVKV